METEIAERYRPNIQDAAHEFYNFLKAKDNPQPADAIFILGSASLSPTQKAFELYQAGFAKKIFAVSKGGPLGGEKEWGMPECEKYKEELIRLGVSPEDIIIASKDKQTLNTLRETQMAIPFMKEYGLNPKRVLIVARPFHQRRVNDTFVQQYKDIGIEFLNCPSEENFDPNDIEMLKELVRQAERLSLYSHKGDIAKSDALWKNVIEAVTIRRYLKQIGAYKGD